MDYKYSSDLSKQYKQTDSPINLHSSVELHVDDFEKVKDFYLKLGFEVVFERYPEGFKGYLVIRLENNAISFWGGNEFVFENPYFKKFAKDTNRGYGVELIIITSKLDKLYEKAKLINCVHEELILQPWGVRDFRIVDPFGYYLRISDPHNIYSDENAVE